MLLAFDTHYTANKAKTACLAFETWSAPIPLATYSEVLADIAEYKPGAFYKRELPCILSLLKQIDVSKVSGIVIDGFVILDDEGKWGLGAYLFEALGGKIPVIGVAKTSFHQNEKNVRAVLRGRSEKPLYITAMGVEVGRACAFIGEMAGDYRMPDLLKLVDGLGREV
jgi:deoxyribonuclease V